jgi:hypothetical protein
MKVTDENRNLLADAERLLTGTQNVPVWDDYRPKFGRSPAACREVMRLTVAAAERMAARLPAEFSLPEEGSYRAIVRQVASIASRCAEGRILEVMQYNNERDANARLIAAAPEMLAALRDILAECEPCGMDDAALGVIAIKARAAIARAEGRT